MSREPWPIPVMWPGATAVIIAGGPSLSLAQVRHVAMARLKNECRVICVNDAVFLAWWADWLHGCDVKWWNWHRETAPKFDGVRTTCTETTTRQWAEYLHVPVDKESGYRGGFAEDPAEVCGGGNGGYQAIQIAVKAGAKKVILLGFDMHTDDDGKPHWFGDHEDKIRSDYVGTMLPFFPTLVGPLKERGIEVLNATPASAIECFQKVRLKEVL